MTRRWSFSLTVQIHPYPNSSRQPKHPHRSHHLPLSSLPEYPPWLHRHDQGGDEKQREKRGQVRYDQTGVDTVLRNSNKLDVKVEPPTAQTIITNPQPPLTPPITTKNTKYCTPSSTKMMTKRW